MRRVTCREQVGFAQRHQRTGATTASAGNSRRLGNFKMIGLFGFCFNLSRSSGRQGKVGGRVGGRAHGLALSTAYRKGSRATDIGRLAADRLLVLLERDGPRRRQVTCKVAFLAIRRQTRWQCVRRKIFARVIQILVIDVCKWREIKPPEIFGCTLYLLHRVGSA